jgi:hypothetical protein
MVRKVCLRTASITANYSSLTRYLKKAASDCVKIGSSSARGQKAFSNSGRKDLFEDASRITLRALADQLKNFYIHYSEDSALWDKKSSPHEIIDQLSPWEEEHLTPDSWGLAVRFYHLSMMWKRRVFIHDIGVCPVTDSFNSNNCCAH